MALFPKDVYAAIKTELEGASLLSYVDVVAIRKYRRGSLPDFDYYCIVINPIVAQSVFYEAAQRYVANEVELILLGKVLNGYEDAVMADVPGGSPPNVGILAMYEDVYRTLYENTLSGEIELYPSLEELDVPTRFDTFTDEASEGFILEARMFYMPRGKRWVDLA